MNSTPTLPSAILPRCRRLSPLTALVFLLAATGLHAQISLSSAVDLAIRNSPRVKMSQADLTKAQAILNESKDVYVPTLTAGAALGQAYGYSPYPPTLFALSSSSLVYSSSQFSYIHAARAGVDAALEALSDAQETVAEDAALTFIALDHDQQREEVLRLEVEYSDRLLQIVQDRYDAGQDTRMDLTSAKLAHAKLQLAQLRATDETATDRAHLAGVIGISAGTLHAEGGVPATPIPTLQPAGGTSYANASVASAFANAKAKQLQARGDARFLYRPQISFVAQYNRYATFTNAFKSLQKTYAGLAANDEAFGVQITIPLLDRQRRSKGIESTADATKALHEAEFAQRNVLDAQSKLSHNLEVLQAQAEVATLEQQVAQQQLEIVQAQLQTASASPQPLTPKDEQNSRINEREKYLAVIDNAFQLHQAQVSLLRQTGGLQNWLRHTSVSPAVPLPSSPPPHP